MILKCQRKLESNTTKVQFFSFIWQSESSSRKVQNECTQISFGFQFLDFFFLFYKNTKYTILCGISPLHKSFEEVTRKIFVALRHQSFYWLWKFDKSFR